MKSLVFQNKITKKENEKKWGKFLPSTFRSQRNVTYIWKFEILLKDF